MASSLAITGAHGFLGSAILPALTEDQSVISLGRHPGDEPWQLTDTHSPTLEHASALIHCAWVVAPRTSSTANTNIAGSLALLDEARHQGIPFVFISSMSASDSTRSRYGRAKREVERHVLRYPQGSVIRPGTIRDEAGGIGMLGESLGRLTALPVQPRVTPDPAVPLVSLDRVVSVVMRHALAPGDDDREVDLVDEWIPLSALVTSFAPSAGPRRGVRVPQALITASTSVAQRASVSLFRDLADSWLGLMDAAQRQPTP